MSDTAVNKKEYVPRKQAHKLRLFQYKEEIKRTRSKRRTRAKSCAQALPRHSPVRQRSRVIVKKFNREHFLLEPQNTLNVDAFPEKRLIAAIIKQVICDASGRRRVDERPYGWSVKIQAQAIRWFRSESTREFGFLWCCRMLNFGSREIKMIFIQAGIK